MKVVHSIGVKFAGGGIGTIAYYEALGAYRANCLNRVLCTHYVPNEINAKHISHLGLLGKGLKKIGSYNWHLDLAAAKLFDRWAAQKIVNCNIFHGWNIFSLESLRKAKKIGAVTFIERASSHPLTQKKLLEEEYRRFGLSLPIYPEPVLSRALLELEECDYVHVPSDFVYHSCLAHKMPKNKLVFIRFGVDLKKFQPVVEKRERVFRALFVGQVTLRKGVQYLLQAWQKLNWKEAELLIVGKINPDFKQIAAIYEKRSDIKFIGFTSNITDLYQQADVFVFPSLEEGSALVTYEALACGLPTITTFNSGSVVRDAKEGFIIPIRSSQAIVEKLTHLREDSFLRQKMALAARKRAEQFSWEEMGKRLVSAYQHVFTKTPK